MASRRMISSETWQDEWFGELGFFEQALWIGLFSTCADDQGRLRDNPHLIRSWVFPYKDISVEQIEAALAGFEAAGKIIRYTADGKRIIQLVNWWDHQPMQWASYSKLPAPPGWSDRIRTRENNRYVEINWRVQVNDQVEQNGDSPEPSPEPSPEDSPETFTCAVQVGRHVPVPVPIPVPIPVTGDITGVVPPDGGGADAPSPPTPLPKRRNLDESTAQTSVPGVKCAQKRSKPPKDPPPPAVGVFHANTQRYPAKALWPDIDQAIGRDPPELKRWETVVRAWLGLGWKATNVNGMLEFYRRNEIPPGRSGNGRNGDGAHRQGNRRNDGGPTSEDLRRILAEREREREAADVPVSAMQRHAVAPGET